MRLRYRLAAVEEVEEIAKWLQYRKSGDGETFVDVFEEAIQTIASDPKHWPRFESALALVPDRDIRRYVMRPFPHMVIYEVLEEFVVVLAVMHPSRDPAYWVDRLD